MRYSQARTLLFPGGIIATGRQSRKMSCLMPAVRLSGATQPRCTAEVIQVKRRHFQTAVIRLQPVE